MVLFPFPALFFIVFPIYLFIIVLYDEKINVCFVVSF